MIRWRGVKRRAMRWMGISPAPKAPPAPTASTHMVAGDEARERGEWSEAVGHYAAALALAPDNIAIHVQHGHALKEAGRPLEAEGAYRSAIAARPQDPDAYLHLGHALRAQGRTTEAINVFAEALRHDPDFMPARQILIAMGERRRLPHASMGRAATAESLATISDTLRKSVEAVETWINISTFPVEAYHAFRSAYPIQPPPKTEDETATTPLLVIVDARAAAPSALRATLASLEDQRDSNWRAAIRAPLALQNHPIGSTAFRDQRIRFIGMEVSDLQAAFEAHPPSPVILTSAGAHFDGQALSWFRYASLRTEAAAAFADHDHYEDHWRIGRVHLQPALQAAPDRDDIITNSHPPAAVILQPTLLPALLSAATLGTSEQIRAILLAAVDLGSLAHLPRILTSRPYETQDETRAVGDVLAPPQPHAQSARDASHRQSLIVVIPTRDQPALLSACVESLIAKADHPERVNILILDNRSTNPETLTTLQDLAQGERVEVRAMDEPFNWARFNNQAVLGSNHDILVFANDDTRMMTEGWDSILETLLDRPDVGLIGARLLYPDLTLQHAGLVLGAHDGRPSHEGVGLPAMMDGPLGRWRRQRGAAAVTGAFMAIQRNVFEDIGRFDETLTIAYNDIDLCLKVRAAGKSVLYAPAIELIHHESKTRGLNDNVEKITWDDAELADLYQRWGQAMMTDPGRNPHWTGVPDNPFEGLRDLSPTQVLAHLDASAAPQPWRVQPTQP